MKETGEKAMVLQLQERVRTWYKAAYPTDELGDEIHPALTFGDTLIAIVKGEDIYQTLGTWDSIVRERLFEKLCEITGLEYGEIYLSWVGAGEVKVWADAIILNVIAKLAEINLKKE